MPFRKLAVVLSCLAVGTASWFLWPFLVPWFSSPVADALPESAPTQAEGGLTCLTPMVDLGSVREPTQHTFALTNRESEAVAVRDVRLGCGCLAVGSSPTSIGPGASAQLVIVVDPRQQPAGRHVKFLSVETSASHNPSLRLEIRFHNLPDVVPPERVEIHATSGKAGTTQFELIDFREKPLKVTGVNSSLPFAQASLVSSPEGYLPGWRYQITLVSSLDTPVGTHSGVVTLTTDDPSRATINIPLLVHQSPRLRVSPSTIHLPKGEGGCQVARLFIRDVSGEPVLIESATPSDGCLECAVEAASSAGICVLVIRYHEERAKTANKPLSVRITVAKPVREELCVAIHPYKP